MLFIGPYFSSMASNAFLYFSSIPFKFNIRLSIVRSIARIDNNFSKWQNNDWVCQNVNRNCCVDAKKMARALCYQCLWYNIQKMLCCRTHWHFAPLLNSIYHVVIQIIFWTNSSPQPILKKNYSIRKTLNIFPKKKSIFIQFKKEIVDNLCLVTFNVHFELKMRL